MEGEGGLLGLLNWAVKLTRDDSNRLEYLNLEDIDVDATQPRRYFDEVELERLAASIRVNGVIEPIIVRKSDTGRYLLVAGERRLKASLLAGRKTIPAVVNFTASQADIRRFQLVENLMRRDLNPVEEANAYLDLIALRLVVEGHIKLPAGLHDRRLFVKDILKRVASGRSEPAIAKLIESVFDDIGSISLKDFVKRKLSALCLPQDLLIAMSDGHLSYDEARAISRVSERKVGSEAHRLRKELINFVRRKRPSLSQLRARVTQACKIKLQADPLGERLKKLQKRTPKLSERSRQKVEKVLDELETIIETESR